MLRQSKMGYPTWNGGGARARNSRRPPPPPPLPPQPPQDEGPRVIPEDLVEPLKVYVSNLPLRVTDKGLHQVLSCYADVEKVILIRDKQTRKSKGYAFAKVKTQGDVNRLLSLSDSDRYIHGQQMVIQLAKKKVCLPGDEGYVRHPLSDRDFDLSLPDPSQASIHMLVDDAILNIFSYLPIRMLVKCERVCRRWQMLVHSHFSKRASLVIDEESLDLQPPFTKPIISKLLILSGPNLKSLKVQRVDFASKQNILKIISQLCPELEHLDVTKARGINFVHLSQLTQGCKHIKSFVARHCIDFDERALRHLLTSYRNLEKLDVTGTSVYGKNFNLLPSTLKELYIEGIPDLCHKKKKITQIADQCPNIEVLEMKECIISKTDLEYFGKTCHNLRKLSVYMPTAADAREIFSNFKNLKDLTLVGEGVDLTKLFETSPQIESLTLDTRFIENEEVDFSLLKKLRCFKLYQADLTRDSLLSLTKCEDLEELHVYKGYSVPQNTVVEIVKGCRKMSLVVCPSLQFNSIHVMMFDKIMKTRSGKLTVRAGGNGTNLTDDYDKEKLKFDWSWSFSMFDTFGYDSDSDYSDVSFGASWYDSDEFPDNYFFDDHEFHEDLFEAAVLLAAWNVEDSLY